MRRFPQLELESLERVVVHLFKGLKLAIDLEMRMQAIVDVIVKLTILIFEIASSLHL